MNFLDKVDFSDEESKSQSKGATIVNKTQEKLPNNVGEIFDINFDSSDSFDFSNLSIGKSNTSPSFEIINVRSKLHTEKIVEHFHQYNLSYKGLENIA